MTTFTCTLNCEECLTPVLHMRPAAFLVKLCNWFPLAQFKMRRANDPPESSIDPKSILLLAASGFEHGEALVVEVTGQCHVLASAFMRIALENLNGFSDDTTGVMKRITALIDKAFIETNDPDLDSSGAFHLLNASRQKSGEEETCRGVVAINDHLHDLTVSVLPEMAKHFGCSLELLFEVPQKGIYTFRIAGENGFSLDYEFLLSLKVEIGTRITVLTRGSNRAAALKAIVGVLGHLWQCDNWLRTHAKPAKGGSIVRDVLAFSEQCGTSSEAFYKEVNNPYLSNLLSADRVFIAPVGLNCAQKEVLVQLATIHALKHSLDLSEVLKRLQDAESKEPVVLRDGFVLLHAAMDWNPRLSIAFGVYQNGVAWFGLKSQVKLVCMVILARGTYGTWRDCLQKLGLLFRRYPGLQGQLINAIDGDDFCANFRRVEALMTK